MRAILPKVKVNPKRAYKRNTKNMVTYQFKNLDIKYTRSPLKWQLFALISLSVIEAPIISESWNVLLYIQADDFLATAAYRALKDVCIGARPEVSLCVQLQSDQVASRYIIDAEGPQLVSVEQVTDQKDALRNALSWAFSDVGLNKTMLIFSGHGTGSLEPTWNDELKRWVYEPDEGDSPFFRFCQQQNEELCERILESWGCKSVFLTRQGSLSRNDLIECMHHATNLVGRKIDCIGFDACNMAMLEIAQDLAPYGQYLIASQECEEKEGWDYSSLCGLLSSQRSVEQVVRALVYYYDSAQRLKDHTLYCLSALDLSRVERVLETLDDLIRAYGECLCREPSQSIRPTILAARQKNQRFCFVPMYADLMSFYEQWYDELDMLARTDALELVKEKLLCALEALREAVIASCAGTSCALARGCSLYFPKAHIDRSYAFDHSWQKFLHWFTCQQSDLHT